jgi:excinuclease ABC subunit C
MFDSKKCATFPRSPGVYLMKDARGRIIYIGKAKDLKSRVRQYFVPQGDERPQVPYLMEEVVAIDTIVTATEKEALLLENSLIKRHQPKYNVLLKDDKSWLGIAILHHAWPRLALVRHKGFRSSQGAFFGPFSSAQKARRAFDLVAKIFPLRQCSDEEFARRSRPCLLYQLKRCPAPCVGLCTHEEYDASISHAKKLLRGSTSELVAEMKREMKQASEALQYEKAGESLRKLELLESIELEGKTRILRGQNIDAIALFRDGEELVISKLIIRGGELLESKHFEFTSVFEDDAEALRSFLLQHYFTFDDVPNEILIPMPLADAVLLEEIFSEKYEKKSRIHHPERGEKRHLVEMARLNAESYFRSKKDSFELRQKALFELQDRLHLSRFPKRIECFDQSHLSGAGFVGASVLFIDGEKCPSGYRRYLIRTGRPSDDYGALAEVLERRLARVVREGNELPDLILIDGGKGHLHIAEKVFGKFHIATCDCVGVAKEEGRHDKGLSQEKFFTPREKLPIILDRTSPALLLVQQIRDEAHRFAITFHQKRRQKETFQSRLDSIPGIGPKKKKALMALFGSVRSIEEKSREELGRVACLSKKDIETIFTSLHPL